MTQLIYWAEYEDASKEPLHLTRVYIQDIHDVKLAVKESTDHQTLYYSKHVSIQEVEQY